MNFISFSLHCSQRFIFFDFSKKEDSGNMWFVGASLVFPIRIAFESMTKHGVESRSEMLICKFYSSLMTVVYT